MPELPEVETTRRGLIDHIVNQKVVELKVHQPALRWRVDVCELENAIVGQSFSEISRRGKYLLFENASGSMMCHLGMSGSLRLVTNQEPRRKHDHFEWFFQSGAIMRFHDPRRFGSVLWVNHPTQQHRLLRELGPEPLSSKFDADYLHGKSKSRKQAVKVYIMNSKIVVGVGNIYASEALFLAGIHPARHAGRISKQRYARLVDCIKKTLNRAIKSGGTTLRDFVNSAGEPGYFRQKLYVYERVGQPCVNCKTPIKRIVQGQRASYYCPHCQR